MLASTRLLRVRELARSVKRASTQHLRRRSTVASARQTRIHLRAAQIVIVLQVTRVLLGLPAPPVPQASIKCLLDRQAAQTVKLAHSRRLLRRPSVQNVLNILRPFRVARVARVNVAMLLLLVPAGDFLARQQSCAVKHALRVSLSLRMATVPARTARVARSLPQQQHPLAKRVERTRTLLPAVPNVHVMLDSRVQEDPALSAKLEHTKLLLALHHAQNAVLVPSRPQVQLQVVHHAPRMQTRRLAARAAFVMQDMRDPVISAQRVTPGLSKLMQALVAAVNAKPESIPRMQAQLIVLSVLHILSL